MASSELTEDSSRREPIEPDVTPEYRPQAVIIDGDKLFNRAGVTYREIANAAKHHVNTVSKKLQGESGTYVNVHDCFTAINALTNNAFSRSNHVLYIDGRDRKVDLALDGCLVFPRLDAILKDPRVIKSAKAIGDDCGVRTMFIRDMLSGRPVSANLVRTLFAELAKYIEISESDELVN